MVRSDVARGNAQPRLFVRAGRLGDITWPIVRDKVEDVITLDDSDIVAAMRLCYERLKVVVEPSGAAGLAAVLRPEFAARHGGCRRVAVILCGGNADLDAVQFFDGWARQAAALGGP